MALTLDDFPLNVIGTQIFGKTKSTPVLTAEDELTAGLVTKFLNEREAVQRQFHQEGNQPLAIVFDHTGMLVARTH